jgi:PAS domain S-box-containing protein
MNRQTAEMDRLEQQSRLALLIGLGVAFAGSVFGLIGGIYFGPVRGAEAALIISSFIMCLILLVLVLRAEHATKSWIPAVVSLYFLAHLVTGSALAVGEPDRFLRATPYLFWYFPLLCFHKFTDFGPYRVAIDRALTFVPLASVLLMTPRMMVGAEVAQINLLIVFLLSYASFAYFLDLFARFRERYVSVTTRAETLEEMTRTLAASELRYRTVYDLVPVLIWEEDWAGVKPMILDLIDKGVTDLETYFQKNPDFVERAIRSVKPLDANRTGARMLGVDNRDMLMAAHSEIIVKPSALQVFRKALLAYATGGREIETEEATFDLQSRKLHLLVKMALPDIRSDETRVILTQMDVTALRQTDERLRLVGQATNDVIWDHDLITDDLWVGDGMWKKFGHRPETITQLDNWAELLHPDDRQGALKSQKAAIHGRADEWTQTYRFQKADKSYAHVRDRALILRNSAGVAERMIGSMMDITEQTELEEQLRQSQRLEAVGRLTGGIAHDFNNLLTVIIGNSEMLEERLANDAKGREFAEMTRASAERAAELTSRLLSFSRRQPLQPRVTDVPARLADLKVLLQRSLGEAVDLDMGEKAAPWRVMVDPPQLDSAILNICINARDAMPKGGRLTISCRNADPASLPDDARAMGTDLVALSITDTGTGMDEATRVRAFEPFFTTKDVGKGSGLGLSMVYGFVRQSGGTVDLQSTPGKGTRVTLYLPRAPDETQEQAADGHAMTDFPGGREHILVVEDDDLVRENLVRQLKSLGYRVTAAADGAEALALLPGLPDIALMLTDVVMPGGVSGWDLARKVLVERPRLKVMFASGFPADVLDRESASISPGHMLVKPYRRQELAIKLRQVLDTAT